MFMNQWEIQQAASARHRCPNVRKGVQLLLRLVEAVNAQSDGWACWDPPSRSVAKLVKLLETAGTVKYGTYGTISDADLRQAVAPIKAMVTRQRKIQARHGNRFDFDVEAALHTTVLEDD